MNEDVEQFLLKHEYDPVKAHAYYLANRKLKGRKKGAAKPKLNEDEVPDKSPTGAKILDFADGRATYSDGSTYDSDGWNKTGHDRTTRINAAQQKLMKLKAEALKHPDPAFRKKRLQRLVQLQRSLDAAKRKGVSRPKNA